MLWKDNDPKKPLDAKVREAAEHYRSELNKAPDLCYIHPSAGPECEVDGIAVQHLPNQLPGYFWIGVYSPPKGPRTVRPKGLDKVWR